MDNNPLSIEQITQDVIEKYHQFVNPTQVALLKIGGFDHIEYSAQGTTMTDLEGNTYIDCLGGLGVFSLGHRHPKVVEAVKRQLDLMPLPSKAFLNKPLADLAAKLAEVSPGNLQYSFLCNSGTEAVEGALKIARMASGRSEIVSTTGAYHGKTMGGLSATGRDLFKTPFEPLVSGFKHVPWNDISALEVAVSDQTAAVILEPIQGEGGIMSPSAEYLPAARRICDQTGAYLILDEVQTGLGRTGRLFACEHWGIVPDILTLAKALGGGVMPVGAVMAGEAIWEKVFKKNPFIHTSTFGGGQLACAAALAAIEAIIEEDLPRKAAENGAYFLAGLRDIQTNFPKVLKDARGLGLLLGIEFYEPDIAKLVIGCLAHKGVIAAYTLNNPGVIRIEPPLIITQSEIDTVLLALSAAIQEAWDLLGDLV